MSNTKHLEFCVDRLVNVYNENPNTDYILNAKKELQKMKKKKEETNPSLVNKLKEQK